MTKDFWLNLPVKDVAKSKDFFEKIGFTFNTQYGGGENSACMLVGDKNVVVMLFDEQTFSGFTGGSIPDVSKGTEVLLSIDAQSKEEVDEMVRKVIEAGGSSGHEPSEMKGWLYGCVFTDLDGHVWNVLHMDMSRMPQG